MLWQLWETPPPTTVNPRRRELKRTDKYLRMLRCRGIFWVHDDDGSSSVDGESVGHSRNSRGAPSRT
jgi:hypothetical protein